MSLESKAKFSVGVSVLILRGGKLLLGRRIDTGTADGLLSTPGGRIEMDETMLQAAFRETYEETAISIDSPQSVVIGFKEHFRYGKHYFMFYVWAAHPFGDPVNVEPHKCQGWDWYDLDSIPSDCTEPPEIIEKLKSIASIEKLKLSTIK